MKVTEKQLKSRVSELNMGILRETTFGIKMERGNKGYDVNLVYRDQTAPEILLTGGSAAEANACIEAVAITHKIYKQSMLGGLEKPEFMTNGMFLKRNGDRCPKTKCGSRDLISGWGEKSGDSFTQVHRCAKCSLEFTKIYKLEGYEIAVNGESVV